MGIGAVGAFTYVVNGQQGAIVGAVVCFVVVIVTQLIMPAPPAAPTVPSAEGQTEPALRVPSAWKKICSLALSSGNKRKL